MRAKAAITIITLWTLLAHAFDPIGPPPVWTLTNTCAFLTKVIHPQVSFAAASVPEVLEMLRADRQRDYSPIYEAEESLLASDTTFSMDQKNVSDFEVLAKLAEKMEAELVISPGKVFLKKRTSKKALQKP